MKFNKYSYSICFKHYLKSLQSEIIVYENSYPLYHCGADGHKVMKQMNGVEMTMGNKWVVLYSLFLLHKYQIHINVKMIKTVQVCKYIHKYIYKEENYITVCFKEIYVNEIAEHLNEHLNEHYIESMQTVYQMLKYLFYKEDSSITVLSIHFSNEQSVYFLKNATVEEIQ